MSSKRGFDRGSQWQATHESTRNPRPHRWLRGLPLIVAITVAPAYGADALSLTDAMNRALTANPAFRSREADVKKQELEKTIARGARLPQLEATATYTRNAYPSLVTPIRQAGVFPPLDRDVGTAGIDLRLPLYAGGKLVATEALADHSREAAEHALRSAGQDLLFNVVTTYTKALQFRHLAAALERRIAALSSEDSATRLRLEHGRATRLDLARLQTQLSQARHDLSTVKQGERDTLALLAALLGESAKLPPLVDAGEATMPMPASEAEALARAGQRPEILAQEAEGRAAIDKVRMAEAERKPQVSLVARVQESAGSDWKGYDDGRIGVQLSLPLFDGGIRRGRVDQARAERERNRLLLQETLNQVTVEIQQSYGGLGEARSRLAVARQGEQEAQEALRIEQLRYQNGESTVSDLLGAETALWNAVVSRLQAGYDIATHQARLLRSVGELTPASFAPTR
jgi:TolC family type I secretion outer membrane protein